MNTEPRQAVDHLISTFFGIFDNRSGLRSSAPDFLSLFSPGAVIASHSANAVDLCSPQDFITPRLALLASGRLLDFHEWETSAATEIAGTLAVRRSRYSKKGTLDGAPYGGEGTKHFQLALIESRWRIVALSWIDDAALPEGTAARSNGEP